ncbi:hypothetical protein TBLA_0D02900 [Henningerozyma blattae CBS 6284]|uniref:Major facilitator superfamily (MFS) profile domain-containing protein n=1 Tax=Henningerozyma blattae (strain ATCC 34711 / CBS 6284 / DSM 70876 / NBRC 10599 / NRRL Y-10934 / UCD 77-7) TaxID=1071380 RepID=I2H338_HENB6|nr:hypothetical protein TBLA_0D02900 [Tetrapisispora blattae CBS 6284]CCH60790.1 hypothetical protein TBLA_0D02900 [Tetrapisispora blattae CBS 6284]
MSDLESISSYDSSQSSNTGLEDTQPQQYIYQSVSRQSRDDLQSSINSYLTTTPTNRSSNASTNQRLKLVKTETVKSLIDMGVSSYIPNPAINAPKTSKKAIFPEEYTLETETGLVPVSTLHSLGRTNTNLSRQRTRHTLSRRNTRIASSAQHDTTLEKKITINSTSSSSSIDKQEQSFSNKVSPQQSPESFTHKIVSHFIDESDNDLESQGELNEIDPEIEFVTFVTNDPENPHNWPLWLRWVYTITLSMLVICVAYGSSCITGGLFTVQEKFHVGSVVSILSCSLMVLGFSFGPLIWSPMSDIYGRRLTYFVSMGLYVIFNIPCAIPNNIATLMICRFFCGVWSSSGLCLVGGSLADMFPSETRGRAIAFFAYAPYCGPVFGPLVNGFISISTRRMDLIFWVNMAFAGAMWIIVALIPETFAPVILKKRAAKLRKETGNPKIMTEQEAQGIEFSAMMKDCVIRPLYFAVTEPVLDLTCFYVCLIYSLLYAFFFAFPVIFGELYDYKDNLVGLMLIPILIGASLALATTFYCENVYLAIIRKRKPTPEDRLLGAMIGAPFAAAALWILGATSYKHIIWVGPASSGLAFGYGMVLIYYSLNNYIIDCYAQYASSALATKVFLRSAGGAAFPLFTPQMYHRLGLQWASWLLAFISTAMILFPFSFYVYGKGWRKNLSKTDYSFDALEEAEDEF